VSIIEIYFDGCFAINFEIILNRYIGTNIVQQIKIFFLPQIKQGDSYRFFSRWEFVNEIALLCHIFFKIGLKNVENASFGYF